MQRVVSTSTARASGDAVVAAAATAGRPATAVALATPAILKNVLRLRFIVGHLRRPVVAPRIERPEEPHRTARSLIRTAKVNARARSRVRTRERQEAREQQSDDRQTKCQDHWWTSFAHGGSAPGPADAVWAQLCSRVRISRYRGQPLKSCVRHGLALTIRSSGTIFLTGNPLQ
jgi:hypothetical protein